MSTAARGGRLRQRALTALVGIPVGLVLIYLDDWYLVAAVALLALLGMREFYGLARVTNAVVRLLADGLSLAAVLGATASLGSVHLEVLGPAGPLVLLGLAAILLYAVLPRLDRAKGTVAREVVGALAGVIYVPLLLSFLIRLRALDTPPLPHRLPPGAAWLFLVIACCWVMDTAAYLVGRAFGRHKLAPKISPGKTVEGGIAGLAAAMLWTAGLGVPLGLTVSQGLLLGAVLGVGGQAGDLCESLLKRRAGVKDSGTLLPGHGGVLDRFDSLLFCAPLGYAVLALFLR